MSTPEKGERPAATTGSSDPSPPRERGERKAWVKPAVRTGQLFESNSLACGKNQPGDQCDSNPQAS